MNKSKTEIVLFDHPGLVQALPGILGPLAKDAQGSF